MTFDPYSDSAASAKKRIKEVFGIEYYDLFNRDPIDMLALFAAMLDASQEQKWMPIKTAPKGTVLSNDGHHFSCYILMSDGHDVVRGRWWRHKDGACNFIQDGGRAFFPSHWMELPDVAAPQPPVDSKLEDSQ